MSEPVTDDAARLRAARGRALAAFVVTLILAGGAFYLLATPHDTPPGGCTVSNQCPGIGHECLHAPTGAYCTHTCNRAEDCEPGTHCDVPPWEKERDPRPLCLHDTAAGSH